MDNFHLSMTSEGDAKLAAALSLAFSAHNGATHYAIRPAFDGEREPAREDAPKWYRPSWAYGREPKPLRLVFLWSAVDDATPFPFKMDAAGAADFARRWLSEADYGKQPDHDGDNERGWRIYNEGWGHVDGQWQAIIAVAPSWAMYGK